MKEDLKSQDLEIVSEEVYNRENTLEDIFKKFVKALEVVERALGIEHASYDDQTTKLSPKELIKLESEQKLVSNQTENLSKGEYTKTDKPAQQRYNSEDSKLAAMNAEKLKQRSQELKVKSQEIIARSRELKIQNEDLMARNRFSYNASKYYQLPDGAP